VAGAVIKAERAAEPAKKGMKSVKVHAGRRGIVAKS
jgi:hypothetical protein